MKKYLFALVMLTATAQAEINHDGYCSEFERRNSCTVFISEKGPECSCPGEPTPPPPPLTGTRCSPRSHRTGMQNCCTYQDGRQMSCSEN